MLRETCLNASVVVLAAIAAGGAGEAAEDGQSGARAPAGSLRARAQASPAPCGPGLRVVATVSGRGTDWQNALNRLAARVADALGRSEHISVHGLADLVRQVEALTGRDGRGGAEAHGARPGRGSDGVHTLSLWAHGHLGRVSLGRDALGLALLRGAPHLAWEWDTTVPPGCWRVRYLSRETLAERLALLDRLAACLCARGSRPPRVNLEACSVALGDQGRAFLSALASRLDAEVFGVTGEHLGIIRFGREVKCGDSAHLSTAPAPKTRDPARAFAFYQQLLDYEPARKDKRAGVVLRVGAWRTARAREGFFGTNYLVAAGADKAEAAVHYRPLIPVAGRYAVELRHPVGDDLAGRVPVTIRHARGATEVRVDQTRGGGAWKRLGVFRFAAGMWATASIVIRARATRAPVVADAVRLVNELEETEVYQANRQAIEAEIASRGLTGPDARQVRERLVGTARGYDPTHPDAGKLEAVHLRENRACAASQAWRSGELDRFSRRRGR